MKTEILHTNELVVKMQTVKLRLLDYCDMTDMSLSINDKCYVSKLDNSDVKGLHCIFVT